MLTQDGSSFCFLVLSHPKRALSEKSSYFIEKQLRYLNLKERLPIWYVFEQKGILIFVRKYLENKNNANKTHRNKRKLKIIHILDKSYNIIPLNIFNAIYYDSI